MNRISVLKGLLIMGLFSLLTFTGCAGINKEYDIVGFYFQESGYNRGFEIKIDDNKLIYNNYDEGKSKKRRLNEDMVADLLDIFADYDIYSWDGYNEVDEDVLDGNGFTLWIDYSNHTDVKAHGSNAFPADYYSFKLDILSFVNNL